MADSDARLVYINGNLVPEHEATISIFDVGRMYGATMYESIRTFKHAYYKLDEHLDRLEASLNYLGLPGLVDRATMADVLNKTLEANIHLTDGDDDIWSCIEITPGEAFPMPLRARPVEKPTIICYTCEMPYDTFVDYYTTGKQVVTALPRNIPPQCYEQRCKNRSRLPHFMAKLWAARVNPHAFAMMLDVDGFITEGTGANIFFVRKGELYTPTTRNILNGISRQEAIEIARDLGITVHETDLTVYDAYAADEAFWSTSSYCLLPISNIDERPIGNGTYPGPVSQKILDEWGRQVGVDIVAQARKFARRSH